MDNCGTTLIVDIDRESRSKVAKLLEKAGFASAQAASGEEALAAARAEQPWLVVLDVELPDISGYEICREFRDEFGEDLSIVFLSGDRTDAHDRAAGLLVGGDDYIVEPFDPGEFLARVRRLDQRRRRHMTGNGRSNGAPEASPLTPRELEVLGRLAGGHRTREIAVDLGISEKTVSSHLQRVLAKFGVNTRAQAVALAYQNGFVGTNGAPAAAPINHEIDQST